MKHLPLLLLLGGLLSASAARSADPVRYVDAATLTVIGKALSTEQPYNRIDTTRFRVPAKTPGSGWCRCGCRAVRWKAPCR